MSSVLTRAVMNALTVQLLPTSYWEDSMITLGFIRNTHRRFYTYVANRINKIKQTTHPEQWFFVPGESNPADLLTTKKLPAQLDQNIWNNGPTMFARMFVMLFDVLSDRERFTHLLPPSYIMSYYCSKSVYTNFDNFCIVYMRLRYFRLV